MYFCLSNLPFLDLCYGTVSMPQALVHCFSLIPTCLTYDVWPEWVSPWSWPQRSASCWLSWPMTVWLLSAIPCAIPWSRMADYVSGWLPSHGGHHLCSLPCSSYPCIFTSMGLMSSTILSEILSLLKLACSDIILNELMILITGVFTLLLPFGFVLLSYVQIATGVLRIHSAQGRLKAFSTCGSHLTVVTIFYGTAISMYIKPQSKSSPNQAKFISMFYGALTSMLNPLIYSLRNKDVKWAMRKVMEKRA